MFWKEATGPESLSPYIILFTLFSKTYMPCACDYIENQLFHSHFQNRS